GTERNGTERNGTERNGTERNGTERNGTLIKLLRYVFGYVRIPLGDVGSICMCKRILKSQTNTASGVPFYKIGTFGKEADAYISQETFDEYRSRYNFPKKGDVLISAAGTIGRTVVYDGKPAYFQDSNIVWIDNDESIVLNSYLRYCYELKPWKASEGGTIPRLYNDNIAKAVIAVPSIEEQKRIVSILDRFDAICNDLTSGLPAEIEARQKQYEYYRDKLLNFRKYKDESSN
ncbi:restriction endonuclease subunit S, partial [Faecalibacterium longum CLA-AA-H243]